MRNEGGKRVLLGKKGVVRKARRTWTFPVCLSRVLFASPRFSSSFEIVARCWVTRYISTGRAKRDRPPLSRQSSRRVRPKSNDHYRTIHRDSTLDGQTDLCVTRRNARTTASKKRPANTGAVMAVSWYRDSLRRADLRDELTYGAS